MAAAHGLSFVIGIIGVLTGGFLAYNFYQDKIYLTSPHPYFLFGFVGVYLLLSLYLIVSALTFRLSLGK